MAIDEESQGLFETKSPLAFRMRPRDLDEFKGQEDILKKGSALRRAIENDRIFSMIFWGPPGCGKTSLARIIAEKTKSDFIRISAVAAGVSDLKEIVQKARDSRKYGTKTILFIDEIHRFNKSQQDYLLPFVEDGTIILIGATTENPGFEVVRPLLSRCRVFKMEKLSPKDISEIINLALQDRQRGLGEYKIEFAPEAYELIVQLANGDARIALNILETVVEIADTDKEGVKYISTNLIRESAGNLVVRHDRAGDLHHQTISAFIKSIRGSDPDAGLYYLARMLEGGEDPAFIVRRMIILASEDIGNADPQALPIAVSAAYAVEHIGMPEAQIVLAQAVTYLATAPKSNASYMALMKAKQDIENGLGELPVPLHLHSSIPYGVKQVEYKYPHNFEGHFTVQEYLPEKLKGRIYYQPTEIGYEKVIMERLKNWWKEKKI